MTELEEKTAKAIERLKAFEPKEGYYLAFSGGKDSVVCKALCDMAGVKYDAHYRLTSVDPPELVQFIRREHPDVEIEKPRYSDRIKDEKYRGKQITMWNLMVRKQMPPTRINRFCCRELKESGGDGRMTITGVRWAESSNRKNNQGLVTVMKTRNIPDELRESEDFSSTPKGGVVLTNDNEGSRRMVEQCYKRSKTTLNPIIDWTDRNVWDFIHKHHVPYCSLYDEGWERIGCIGCPMASTKYRERDFLRYPTYKKMYLKCIEKCLANLKERGIRWGDKLYGKDYEATVEDYFNWWMENDVLPNQMTFEDMENDE